MARQGHGETRSRTEGAAEDRGGGGAKGPRRAATSRFGADGSWERRRTGGASPSSRSGPSNRRGADPAAAPDGPTLGPRARGTIPLDARGLDAAERAVLERGLDLLGLDLDPATLAAISRHAALVLAWTHHLNLTATRDPEAFLRDHVLDSLTAVPLLRARGIDRFLDLGSGAGLPGVPLALALPAERCLLVEARAKKAAFLERAILELGCRDRIAVVAERAEEVALRPAERAAWPAATARAVAPLAELIELALPLLQVGGVLVAWKGARLEEELPAAERAAAIMGAAPPEVVEPAGSELRGLLGARRLVIVEKRRPTPAGVPRSPAVRRRRPW